MLFTFTSSRADACCSGKSPGWYTVTWASISPSQTQTLSRWPRSECRVPRPFLWLDHRKDGDLLSTIPSIRFWLEYQAPPSIWKPRTLFQWLGLTNQGRQSRWTGLRDIYYFLLLLEEFAVDPVAAGAVSNVIQKHFFVAHLKLNFVDVQGVLDLLGIHESQDPYCVLAFFINPIHQGKCVVGWFIAFRIDIVRGGV